MEGFSIKIEYYPQNNNIVIIKLIGYVDQSNSHQIEKVISDLIQSKKQKFVFDLSELIYMSSAGWGIFVGEIKSVRDAGGDIKVASMSPEIYDVFQVLEFYHLLEDYSTVNEAISSFLENGNEGVEDLLQDSFSLNVDYERDRHLKSIEPNSSSVQSKKNRKIELNEVAKDSGEKRSKEEHTKHVVVGPETTAPTTSTEIGIDLAKLPLSERIKKIVGIYPLLNVKQIRKMLQHEKFGSVKISSLKVYRMLRILNLHTKINRYRYYRSV
jgi:anti-sigma B factor antagonist